MKKYICTIPSQPDRQLRLTEYDNPEGNETLRCSEGTRFPIIPVIRNTAEKGDELAVFAVKPDYKNCEANLSLFREELDKLAGELGVKVKLSIIDTPYSESVSDHLNLFEKIISVTADGDDICADITFGSKPVPMIMLMAMNYAYRFHDSVNIRSIVYGQFDHDAQKASLYDVSALFYMNSTVDNLARSGEKDPAGFIRKLLEL